MNQVIFRLDYVHIKVCSVCICFY